MTNTDQNRTKTGRITDQPSSYRWVILVSVWLTYLTAQILRLSAGPIAPFLRESLDLTRAEIGLLSTATGIIYQPTLAVAGWVSDRFGVRRVLIFGSLIGGIMVTLIFFFPSYHAMLILMILSGIGFGCIFATATKGIILWFPQREKATALGFNQTGVNIAGIIGASLFPAISLAFGWQYSYLITGLLVLVIGAGGAFLYHDPPELTPSPVINRTSTGTSLKAVIKHLKSRNLWLLAVGTLFIFIVEFAIMANLVLYLNEDLKFGVVIAGSILAIAQISGAFVKPFSGLISDRLVHGQRKPVFLTMCIISAGGCLLPAIGISEASWLVYPLFILLGAVTIGCGGIYVTLAGEVGGGSFIGTSVGVITAIAGCGNLAGPPLFGLIVDITGSYRPAWAFLAICSVIASILIGMIREPHHTT